MANSYLAQEEYAHAYVELKKLEVRQTADMKQDEIEKKINLCLDHLSNEEIKIYEQIVSSYWSFEGKFIKTLLIAASLKWTNGWTW